MKKPKSATKVTAPLRKNSATSTTKGGAGDSLAKKFGMLGDITKKTDKSHQKRLGRPSRGAIPLGGEQDTGRFGLIWLTMALAFGVLVWRMMYLQVWNAQFYIEKGNAFINRVQYQPTQRGMIIDASGATLAANAPLSTVIFSPYDYAKAYYENKRKLINAHSDKERQRYQTELDNMALTKLAAISQVPIETLTRAVGIDENIDVNDAHAVEDALPKGQGRYRLVLMNKVAPEVANTLLSHNFKAVAEERFYQRYYLQPEPTAQLLGYMSFNAQDNRYHGRTGLEAKFDSELQGKTGKVLTLKGRSDVIEQIREIEPQVAGQNIQLTIDSRLQYILYKELEELGRQQSALSTQGMVVDVHTGDVLAMSSWPSFNSNNLNERTGATERNRPVQDVFEPGSVMKPFTVAAALESGKYNTNTLINTSPGVLSVGAGSPIRDAANLGTITMAKLIQKSSNVGAAKIALNLPADAIADMQKRFGFGQKTNLNLTGEMAGRVNTPKASEIARRATLSYGYGQQVTLAQIAQAYAVLGNDGKLAPLRLIKSEPIIPATQVISENHAQSIVAMMRTVTEDGGTAPKAAINGYHVAGKTGTARRESLRGGYEAGRYRNICAGVAPASNPRFAVVILVDDPRKDSYAGKTAAPTFAKVMKETLRLYNVPFDKPLDATKD